MPFCKNCGTKLDDTQKFCHTCGAAAEVTTAPVDKQEEPKAIPTDTTTEKKEVEHSGGITVTTKKEEVVKGKCKACGEQITGAVVMALDAQWHKDCFKCQACKQKIFSFAKFAEKDGFPLCLKCSGALVPTCCICRQKIPDEHIVMGDKHIHNECCVCATCGKPAKKDFYEDNGKIFHLICD